MIEISEFDGITQIRMSREVKGEPLFWVSAYLVDDLLIDSGCMHTSVELMDFLDSRQISRVVNTHYHEDHIGANGLLQERRNVEILAHEWSLDFIGNPPGLPRYREQAWGKPLGSSAGRCPDFLETENYKLEVVDTPGHCPGHISLVERTRGWVFSGDLFIGRELWVAGPETDVTDMIRSMKNLMSMHSGEFTLLTSLRTIRRDGRKALSGFVSRYQELAQLAKSLASSGMDTKSIVNRLFGQESVFDAMTAGQYSSANLVKLLLEAEI